MDRINALEKEIEDLRKVLKDKEDELYKLKNEWVINKHRNGPEQNCNINVHSKVQYGDLLPKWAIERYSRQILLPEIGVQGQKRICEAKVLIVGAGGLGCPAALYLAGAGVGEIGIVDYDSVDITNIHRQVLHGERDEHMSKAESAARTLRSINSHIKIQTYNLQLGPSNAMAIAKRYDLVLDCTDNVPTRYLLNDLCVLSKLPLISGSALKMEGQLTIYGYRANENTNNKMDSYAGPCYRCLFPTPPPPEAVGSCSANGVAGPIPGVIGVLQAIEAIKYIVGYNQTQLLVERLLLFDGDYLTFRNVQLRPRNPQCAACSDNPTIILLKDYEVMCKMQAKEKKDSRENCARRKIEKEKRMLGQSYLGFRVAKETEAEVDGAVSAGAMPRGAMSVGAKRKCVQDVVREERKIGPPCIAAACKKSGKRRCTEFEESQREEIFRHFWNGLDWKGKKAYVRDLVDSVPPKRRRLQHKNDVSRKGDSKLYHLRYGEEKYQVCRVMFLNTLGIKEAMVRCWLTTQDKPKAKKIPIQSLNVDSYINSLPHVPPKCGKCAHDPNRMEYIDIPNVKSIFQLYLNYVKTMRSRGIKPASRKTFSSVLNQKRLRVFRARHETDVCDVVPEHNSHIDKEKCFQENYFFGEQAHHQSMDNAHTALNEWTITNIPNIDLELHILPPENRITPSQLAKDMNNAEEVLQRHLLVDVRSEAEFQMCRIDGSVNYPIEKLRGEKLDQLLEEIKKCCNQVTFICRRGNDSQVAAKTVLDAIDSENGGRIKDLTGGLHAWSKDVDNDFPVY